MALFEFRTSEHRDESHALAEVERERKRQCALSSLRVPEGSDCNVFINGHQLFITLSDSKTAAMDADTWYKFGTDWESA